MKKIGIKAVVLVFIMSIFTTNIYAQTYLDCAKICMDKYNLKIDKFEYEKKHKNYNQVTEDVYELSALHYGFLGSDGFVKTNKEVDNYEYIIKDIVKYALYNDYEIVSGEIKDGQLNHYKVTNETLAINKDGFSNKLKNDKMVTGVLDKNDNLIFIWTEINTLPTKIIKGNLFLAYDNKVILTNTKRYFKGTYIDMKQNYFDVKCDKITYNQISLNEYDVNTLYSDREVVCMVSPSGISLLTIL